MPDNKPETAKQALAGCSLVLALLGTITLVVLWATSGEGFDSSYTLPALIGCVVCVILGKQAEPPAAP